MLAAGAAYTAGAVVYSRKRPDPWPAVFGFHEVFHACTLVGAALFAYVVAFVALPRYSSSTSGSDQLGPRAAAGSTKGASDSISARTSRAGPAAEAEHDLVDAETGEVLELRPRRRSCRRGPRRGGPDPGRPLRPGGGGRGRASASPPPPMGIHPSAISATVASTVSLAPPPTSVRTRGCCTGLGHDQVGPKSTNSPWNSACSLDQMASAAARCSRTTVRRAVEVDPVVLRFGPVPPEAHAERDAPVRQGVERRHLLGQQDRVVLGHEQDSGAEPDPLGDRGRHGQRHERIQRSACSRRGARPRRGRAARPRAPADGCARAARASRSRAPPPSSPARRVRRRGR